MGGAMPYISAVVPLFNEEKNVSELCRRLKGALDALGKKYELVMVDDGSTDKTLEKLLEAQKGNQEIKVIEFNRNYGQHSAVFAGFENSEGEIIITLDGDLQNPPEEIEKLVSKIEEGYEVVGTYREFRRDSIFRKIPSFFINLMTSRITGVRLKDYGCMLRAYRRDVVENICASGEMSTFIPALAVTFAKKIAEIPVGHHARKAGTSKYGLLKLISLQFDLVTSFSNWPLRALMLLGTLMAILGVGFGVFLGAARIIIGSDWELPGMFSLFAVLFLFVGVQFLAFGLLGEYIARIYSEVRKRPRYIVKKIHSAGKN